MFYPLCKAAFNAAAAGAFNQSSGGDASDLIKGLFAQGQQGFWFPFTDFASLSQDSAGTLPYTALEQPVGRVLDRSGRGNHASQATSTARGVVSARVNMLASAQSFGSGSGWGGPGVVITPADIPSPLGGMADKIEMTAIGSDWRQLVQTVSTVVGTSYSGKFLVKAAAPEDIGKVIAFRHATGSAYLLITLTADWAWVGRDEVSAITTTQFAITHRPSQGTTSGVISFHLAAAELKLSSQASLPYQRVTTATDYDAVGFPKSLRLEVDDFYTCGGGGSTTGFYFADVIRPMGGAGTARFIATDRVAGYMGYMLLITAEGKVELALGGGGVYTRATSTESLNIGTAYWVEALDDGVNLQVRINNGTPVSTPRPTPSYGVGTMTLFRNPVGDSYFNGQVTEPIYRAGPPPSAYERGVIRAHQMKKAGMV